MGFTVPTMAYNRGAWMEKAGEYQVVGLWVPGWVLELVILTQRTYEDECGHYYFSSHNEDYTQSTFFFPWTEYSEDVDIFRCPMCHEIYKITYEVHGRFAYYSDSSNYYDITLTLKYYADSDYIDPIFGPCSDHLVGDWRFFEDSGIETS